MGHCISSFPIPKSQLRRQLQPGQRLHASTPAAPPPRPRGSRGAAGPGRSPRRPPFQAGLPGVVSGWRLDRRPGQSGSCCFICEATRQQGSLFGTHAGAAVGAAAPDRARLGRQRMLSRMERKNKNCQNRGREEWGRQGGEEEAQQAQPACTGVNQGASGVGGREHVAAPQPHCQYCPLPGPGGQPVLCVLSGQACIDVFKVSALRCTLHAACWGGRH